MKKALLLFLTSLTFNVQIIAQNKIATPIKKNTQPSKPEIDRLADKYKDMATVILYTSHGDLTGNVDIENNIDNKPQSITINGKNSNTDAISEFLSQVIAQKKQQGYKSSDGQFESNDATWIKSLLGFGDTFTYTFKKGSMYFIAMGGHKFISILDKLGEVQGDPSETSYYWFSIETGDNSRKGGNKATKFDF